jgi:AcrR family transcriptional regulator
MSPRPRTISNAEILEGTARAISRIGAARLTLADAAHEVGLAPATLLQRFGSKRALLLALAEQELTDVEARFDDARRSTRSPLAALVEVAGHFTRHGESPAALANHLAFLHVDLDDADFSRLAVERERLTLAGFRSLLDEAVLHGEITRSDTSVLARAVQSMMSGSLMNWAVHREGPVAAWLRADLDALLAPHRARLAQAPETTATLADLPARPAPGTHVPRPSGPRARHAGR